MSSTTVTNQNNNNNNDNDNDDVNNNNNNDNDDVNNNNNNDNDNVNDDDKNNNNNNKTLEELVRDIQKMKISSIEKNTMIQNLFNKQYKNTLDRKPSSMKCTHYTRNIEVLSPCCGVYVPCRFCHNENNLCDKKFDRFKIEKVMCTLCNYEQAPLSNKCLNCEKEFSKHFCEKCNLYTDATVFHCDDCGFCRVGEQDQHYHCPHCDVCYGIGHKEYCKGDQKQTISGDVRDMKCPICLEELFTNPKPYQFLICGHGMHTKCFEQNINCRTLRSSRCPLCSKSILVMDQVWAAMRFEKEQIEMPDKYKTLMKKIICNDCSKECETEFHVVGLECKHCGGFNTRE